jgi:hypothetical protein
MADDEVTVPVLASWPGIELVAVGEWPLSSGVANFTSADLQEACAATRCPSVGQPIIKLGHQDPRFDGEPAIGWVSGMRLNETQTKLLGDFTGMPGWLAEILPSAYPARSIEGCWSFTCQTGHVHPFVITGVALLGVTPPGVGTIANLNDVAGLYGVTLTPDLDAAGLQAARPFRTIALGAAMPPQRTAGAGLIDTTRRQAADAAGVIPTVDDIRREYYDDADYSEWIVEVQIDGGNVVLIVIDDTDGELKRVPVDLSDPAHPVFGPDQPVLVSYVDAPPEPDVTSSAAFPAGRQVAASWGSRTASRAGIAAKAIASHSTATDEGTWDGGAQEANLADDATSATYRRAYAWADPDGDPDTQAGYRFIHHFVGSDGAVGAASTVGCSAGIAVLNGGRGGTTIPDGDVQGVWAHLAKHLTDADMEPPELTAAAGLEDDPDVQGAQRHGPFDGEHEHPHADGSGGVHFHSHSHAASATHDHEHSTDAAAAAPTQRGAADMQLSDDVAARVRAALGLADDAEVTEAHLADLAARAAPAEGSPGSNVPAVIDAAAPETPVTLDGTYLVDGAIIQDWRNRALAGDAATRELAVRERDSVLAAAVVAGKFPQARLEHYQQMWSRDPDGTRRHVDTLASGLVPMGGPLGTNPGWDPDMEGDFDSQAAYKKLFPDEAGRR